MNCLLSVVVDVACSLQGIIEDDNFKDLLDVSEMNSNTT